MLVIDVQNDGISTYLFSKKQLVAKKTYFCSLSQVVYQWRNEPDHHLLFSPSEFLFHTAHMVYAAEYQFTISDYKKLLNEKIAEIRALYGVDYDSFDIDLSVGSISGESAIKELLGKTGVVNRSRHIHALRPKMKLQLRELYGTEFTDIVYASRHVIFSHYLSGLLHRDSFICVLLSIDKAELWTIRAGFADTFAYAPLGTHILFEAAQEQGVQKYIYETNDTIPNQFVQKLLFEAILFYWGAVIQWIEPYLESALPVVVCTGSFHPAFFSLAQELFQGKGVFMMPYTPKQAGFTFSGKTIDDIPVGAYVENQFSGL